MGCQVQFNGTPGVLSHGADALDAGDEGLHVFWTLDDVETQSTNPEECDRRRGRRKRTRRSPSYGPASQMPELLFLALQEEADGTTLRTRRSRSRSQEACRRPQGRGRTHRIAKGVRLVGLGTDSLQGSISRNSQPLPIPTPTVNRVLLPVPYDHLDHRHSCYSTI
jgi:hypothetical protein